MAEKIQVSSIVFAFSVDAKYPIFQEKTNDSLKLQKVFGNFNLKYDGKDACFGNLLQKLFPAASVQDLVFENLEKKDLDEEEGAKGRWRFRFVPNTQTDTKLSCDNKTLNFEIIRNQGRLKISKIYFSPKRDIHPLECVVQGSVLLNKESAPSYMDRDDLDRLTTQIPQRQKELIERTTDWDSFLNHSIEITKQMQKGFRFVKVERLSFDTAKFTIIFDSNNEKMLRSIHVDDEMAVVPLGASEDKYHWKSTGKKEDRKEHRVEKIGTFIRSYPVKTTIEIDKIIFKQHAFEIQLDEEYEFGSKVVDNAKNLNQNEDKAQNNGDSGDKPVVSRNKKKQTHSNSSQNADPLQVIQAGFIINSIGGDLGPLINQIRALNRLINGDAKNPRLEDFIFDINEVDTTASQGITIDDDKVLEKRLNPLQKRAIEKALSANDIFLLQGPPGTGKTTFIAELCYQVASKGGRVLVASQTNLAVDNALSKLLDEPKMLPIRIGKPDRITEEGDRFIEKNVVDNWFKGVKNKVTTMRDKRKNEFDSIDRLEKNLADLTETDEEITQISTRLLDNDSNINRIEKSLDETRLQLESLKNTLENMDTKIDLVTPGTRDDISPASKFQDDILAKIKEMEPGDYARLNDRVNDLLSTNDLVKILGIKSPRTLEPSSISTFLEKYLSLRKVILDASTLSMLRMLKEICKSQESSISGNEEYKQLVKQRDELMTTTDEQDAIKLIAINRQIKSIESKSTTSKGWKETCKKLYPIFASVLSEDFLDIFKSLRPTVQVKENIDHLIDTFENITSHDEIFEKIEQIFERHREDYIHDLNVQKHELKVKIKETQSRFDTIENESKVFYDNQSLLSQKMETLQKRFKKAYFASCEILGSTREPDLERSVLIERVRETFNAMTGKKQRLDQERQWMELQSEWLQKIDKASHADREEIKQIYLKKANIIGATCNETGRHDFYENNLNIVRPFDMVIIDEVSKATPTELLMPMLLGKRIVLVGDHRQLPPLFKEEKTFLEAAGENDESVEELVKKYRAMVTSSYFEEMFLNAPDDLKETLTVQYRMHPQIMNIINQFYIGCSQLSCGLEDPDKERQHAILLKSEDKSELYPGGENIPHVLWIDSTYKPDGKLNFEEKPDHSTSKLNRYELQLTSHLLENIYTFFANHPECKEKVALISFYGAQVKELHKLRDRIIQNYKIDSKQLRVGTVDRYQGMECPIVILSLVSSPQKGYPTSFVKDYRRINVAMSRAQKLLMIIGSAKVFKDAYVQLTDSDREYPVYGNIIKMVKDNQGFLHGEKVLESHLE